MAHLGQYNSPLLSTYSSQSFTDEGKTISEAEEIKEVKLLHRKGIQAAKKLDFDEAVRCYNEALEIDSKNAAVLQARCLTFLKQQKTEEAVMDAEAVLSTDPNSSHGHFLKGLAYHQMNMFTLSLDATLTALKLDHVSAERLTNHIAKIVSKHCLVPSEQAKSLKTMHPYRKLSEIGVILFQNQRYEACVNVLTAAENLQTNQKGITMQILFTQASAHSQLSNNETAVGLFHECLNLAMATHDQMYQTKCLVNIATIYQNSGDTDLAIVFYERLLHLETELLATTQSGDAFPTYWTQDLQCGLHLNLSIAYKAVGNMVAALAHARKYTKLVEKFGMGTELLAKSHHDTGALLEISGNYLEACQCYEKYLALSQRSGNEKDIGQAYGSMARVHAALRNWPLSLSYHDHCIDMAATSKDSKMMAVAHEIKGDTLCLKGDYEQAIEHYSNMQSLCQNLDNSLFATSLLKLAKACMALERTQSSLYFLGEALSLAEKFSLREIETEAEFYVACINKDSSQYKEREEAQRTFMKLIPYFEKKIALHAEESTNCPQEYEEHLTQCYDGMQAILSAKPNKLGCLQYAEAYRRHGIVSVPSLETRSRGSDFSLDSKREIWDTDYIKRIVSQQNATILYYSVLENQLLLWVLRPVEGIARFYCTRTSEEQTFPQQITALLAEMQEGWDRMELISTSEARALPLFCDETTCLRTEKLRLSREKSEVMNSTVSSEEKSALESLFDLLIGPAISILEKLEKGSHLIVVPDKQLKFCPFGALLDCKNTPLCDRFRISYVPCLLLLDQVIRNEKSSVSTQADLEFQQQQARNGGLSKEICEVSENLTLQNSAPETKDISESSKKAVEGNHLNLKEVSNPRLASSRTSVTSEAKEPNTARSQKSAFHSTDGFPSNIEKVMSSHTYSTLTAQTWTGTDITSSTQMITWFHQLSDQRKALVFGCPKINQKLKIHNKDWVPKSELEQAQKELILVADWLGTCPTMGMQATRQELMESLETAEIVHIATWACLHEGLLLVTPEPAMVHAEDSSHLVGVLDILNLKLRAKLVTLSTCGLTPTRADQDCCFKLASAFLSAGAESVLACMWPIPDDALHKFMFNFYFSLQNGELLSEALYNGTKSIQEDGRWSHACQWACFVLIGKDTRVSINELKHAQLDQTIDKCEQMVESISDKSVLSSKAAVSYVASKEENMIFLQKHVKNLLQDHHKNPLVIPGLVDLLDSALKRLHSVGNNHQLIHLNDETAASSHAMALLKWLGFHFQAKGMQLTGHYVIFPQWDKDQLLLSAYEVLRASTELVSSPRCFSALWDILPLTQDNISNLIDLMCITKHAPEIQLKVTDLSVHPLWHYAKTRTLLSAIGFHQVGLLLTFNAVSVHKQLLTSMLQVLVSISCFKSSVLLYRLDATQLGHPGVIKVTSSILLVFSSVFLMLNMCMLKKPHHLQQQSSVIGLPKLPSLKPLLLSGNRLRMSTPWFSVLEHRDEMHEKMRLAKSTSDINRDYHIQLRRARTWHQMSLAAQANETLVDHSQPSPASKAKVKVKPGSTLSQKRTPVDEVRQLTSTEIKQRRDHAHSVLQERAEVVEARRKNSIIKLYLPYVNS